MRSLFFFSFLFFAYNNGIAAILTVDNKVNAAGQYTTIADAMAAGSSGDTILVAGSPTSYGSITVTNKFVFFGAGHHTDLSVTDKSTMGGITFNTGSAGSNLSGFEVSGVNINVDSIHISDCWFLGNTRVTIANNTQSHVVEGCRIQGEGSGSQLGTIVGPNTTNVYIDNVIIRNNILGRPISRLKGSGNMILQNLILRHSTGGFSACEDLLVENNIFYGVNDSTGCTNCIFYNNMDYYYDGSDYVGTDPEFVNLPALPTNNNTTFNNQDLAVQPTSPILGAGTGGQDLGPLGGVRPYDYNGYPSIPRLTSLTVPGLNHISGSTISVTVQAISNQ